MNEEIERLVGAVSESEKSVRGEPVQNPKLRYFNPFELFDQTGSVDETDAIHFEKAKSA